MLGTWFDSSNQSEEIVEDCVRPAYEHESDENFVRHSGWYNRDSKCWRLLAYSSKYPTSKTELEYQLRPPTDANHDLSGIDNPTPLSRLRSYLRRIADVFNLHPILTMTNPRCDVPLHRHLCNNHMNQKCMAHME